MTATVIDGKAIAARMRGETLPEAQALTAAGWTPRMQMDHYRCAFAAAS